MASSSAQVKDTGWKKFKKTLAKIGDLEVAVGIPGEINFSIPTQAAIGIAHEFGTETIPARSFIRSTFDTNRDKFSKLLGKYAERVVKTKKADEAALFKVGEVARADVINRIVSQNLDNLPLAASTLAAKAPKTKALIDTGELVGSIVSEVRKRAR